MPNSHNIEIVDQLTKKFNSSKGIYLTCYTGLNVIKKTELRKKFRENDVDYFVSKNASLFIRYVNTFVSFSGDNKNQYFLFLQKGLFDRSRICGKVPISSELKQVQF